MCNDPSAFSETPRPEFCMTTTGMRPASRARSAKSPSRATATQPAVSGDIAPQANDGLGVRGAERAVLAERVDAVARPLEVRLHPRKVAPAVLVLVADDPGEPALDRLERG